MHESPIASGGSQQLAVSVLLKSGQPYTIALGWMQHRDGSRTTTYATVHPFEIDRENTSEKDYNAFMALV